ncbi:MAG: zinc ABC transporter substrate-binding protein [Spirochaetes bacterium]|nr:zinc ABC transporter substrate-binding protein [Spirochaetota bacterium]
MKRIAAFVALTLLFLTPAFAARMKVMTTYPYIASIVEQIGRDKVRVQALARGDFDPHTIMPKPSFIAKLRRGELLIINGAQLEIGWLPPLLRQANNPAINPGSRGFLDLSRYVKLIDVPTSISRAQGDIHPDGNPHYYLDPHNIPPLARGIAAKLAELDSANAGYYAANRDEFLRSWSAKQAEWDRKLASLRGKRVIEYHKNFDYLLRSYGIILAGTVEPLPGIPPTSRHIENLERVIGHTKVHRIFQDVYNPDRASRFLSKKYDIPLVRLPHDVGAVREAEGIYSLFDEMVRRLAQ